MAMSLAEEIILCVGYAIIFIANIVGNLFVCAVVLKTNYLQNFTSILIVNMAVGDLIVGVSGVIHIVLEVWFLVSGNNNNTVFCGRLNGITFFSASISIYTMAVLAVHCKASDTTGNINERQIENHPPSHMDVISRLLRIKHVFY